MKKVILEEIENMKYLLGYKRGVVISEQQAGNQKFNFNANPALSQGGGINYTPTAPADMFKNAQAAVAAATTQATGTPATQQKFNFNPNPNINPESGINFKPQTSQEMAKGVASATPATPAPAAATPVTPIKIGVKDPLIEELQNTLNTKFQSGLTPDGKYGPKTAASVLAALQKAPTTPTNTTPVNTVVGGDPNSEVAKKTAEANASTGIATNTTPSTSAQNTQPSTGGANFTDVDNSEFS
jgi:hypothetical protein